MTASRALSAATKAILFPSGDHAAAATWRPAGPIAFGLRPRMSTSHSRDDGSSASTSRASSFSSIALFFAFGRFSGARTRRDFPSGAHAKYRAPRSKSVTGEPFEHSRLHHAVLALHEVRDAAAVRRKPRHTGLSLGRCNGPCSLGLA
jgi:hypothetical protein